MAGQVVPARQRIVVPFNGHVIGEGFNSDTAERVGTGLSVSGVGEDPIAPGQAASFKFNLLTSQASLERALNISAEIEARYALFSGGGKFDFAESSAVNTTSTYIVASCVIQNAIRFGRRFEPNETARRLIQAGDPAPFKNAFGDRFTQALHTGGEFHALVRITSSNVEHQRRIAASLHAELNGLFTSASFKGSLAEAQKDTSSHTEVVIQVHQTGGVGPQLQIPGTDADKIRDHMNQFAAAAHQHAAAYEAELVSYDVLALPFPPLTELEDRRRVLEDCLARRQRYYSIISDLTFAQSEDAPLMFENLPEATELVDLQNRFRQILNDLMAHARKVSQGSIEPSVFVAKDEPPAPRFKRRTAGSFATWWARFKDNDPGLLKDERLLIERIAAAAAPLLTVPGTEASPETMERAADLIDVLHLESAAATDPALSSIAALPKMIDAPLRKVFAFGSQLRDLSGLEPFLRLEMLSVGSARLRDLQAIGAAAGLLDVRLQENELTDLTPLQSLENLEVCCLQGNKIESLEPLRRLSKLAVLSIASAEGFIFSDSSPAVDFDKLDSFAGFQGNPVADARALADLPRLANPLTSGDQLSLRVFTIALDPVAGFTPPRLRLSGTAMRIGDSNRFQLTDESSGESQQIILMGMTEWDDLRLFPSPVVVSGVHFAHQGVGIACTSPVDRQTTLDAGGLLEAFLDGDIAVDLKFLTGGGFPHVFVEVQPA